MRKEQLMLKLLNDEFSLLDQSVITLLQSMEKCSVFFGKEVYSFEEMESFDSLTSKFGRTADLYTQKVLRTLWGILHEPYVPMIDFFNRAEKLKIILSADQLLTIRDLRNQITHEYLPQAITELVTEVIENCSVLVNNIEVTRAFIKGRE
jgi:hypothetical protein